MYLRKESEKKTQCQVKAKAKGCAILKFLEFYSKNNRRRLYFQAQERPTDVTDLHFMNNIMDLSHSVIGSDRIGPNALVAV
jgi:hypothetical protein